MSDGYDGYNAIACTPGIERLACWAHVRRRFVDAVRMQAKGKRGKADEAVGLFGKLHAIEQPRAPRTTAATQFKPIAP